MRMNTEIETVFLARASRTPQLHRLPVPAADPIPVFRATLNDVVVCVATALNLNGSHASELTKFVLWQGNSLHVTSVCVCVCVCVYKYVNTLRNPSRGSPVFGLSLYTSDTALFL